MLRSLLRLPDKLGRKAALAFYKTRYSREQAAAEQARIFGEWGLSRQNGIGAVERIYAKHPEFHGSMQSEHHVMFGAASAALKPKRILEIGTYDGRGAAMLATLFPESRIDSIDLPDDHPIFKDTYKRSDPSKRQNFIKSRDELMGRFKNINFEQMHSAALVGMEREKYDLIWVDGDHGYPTVAIDIVNAVRLLNSGGIMMCDDVVRADSKRGKEGNSVYQSAGSHQTLEALSDAGVIRYGLIYKRLDPKSNANPNRRKFIGIAKRL